MLKGNRFLADETGARTDDEREMNDGEKSATNMRAPF